MIQRFLSCDWGTSSFRLRLVETKTMNVIAEQKSDEGIASTFDAWKKINDQSSERRLLFYSAILKKNCEAIENKLYQSLDGVPVFISGMASSTIGILELPYHTIPFPVNGSQLKTHKLKATDYFKHDTWIISGVRSEDDVMRGEETQLIGLVESSKVDTSKESTFIFPGTHSKHMQIQNKNLVAFKTYMTGEFFNLLSQQSILKDSIEFTENKDHFVSFRLGVASSLKSNLLHAAFSVRTNALFNKLTKAENYFYLSGLVIGTELKDLQKKSTQLIYLCSGSNLSLYYNMALEVLGLSDQTTVISSQLVDEAAIHGQFKIYNSLNHE